MNRPTRHPKRVRWCAAVGLALIGLTAGCAEERDAPPPPVTWQDDIEPLADALCVSCHGGEAPAGDYSLSTYQGALSGGTDIFSNAIAGQADSRILTILGGGRHQEYIADAGADVDEVRLLMRRWVVDSELAYFVSAFHGPDIQNPRAEHFHGEIVEQTGWTMASCRECHGDDYAGGVFAGRIDNNCTDCHPQTPEACDTCHGSGPLGAPPPTLDTDDVPGAHLAHLDAGPRFRAVECSACHLVPETFDAPGHIDNAGDGLAEVQFQGVAQARGAVAEYAYGDQSCSGTYCHGVHEGAEFPTPEWTDTRAGVGCTSCHGYPPDTTIDGDPHPDSPLCAACHTTAAFDGTIAIPEQHVDGVVQVRAGVGAGACDACHAGPADPVPFYDASGRTDPTLTSVGEHEAHVGATFFHAEEGETRGYACTVCHPVPGQVDEALHLDGEVQIFLSGPAVGPATSTLQPAWNEADATCSNVWCHGAALSGGQVETPLWNVPADLVVCGTCHGIPPDTLHTGGNHPPAQTCGGCHGNVITDDFQWVDRSLHANGEVNLGGAP